MHWKPTLVLLSIAALALAGCSDNGAEAECTTPEPEGGIYTITMQGVSYAPDCIIVPVGSTVAWVNEGGSHNIAPDGHDAWEETTVKADPGKHLQVTFDEPGTYDYFCRPHKSLGMVGTVIVE